MVAYALKGEKYFHMEEILFPAELQIVRPGGGRENPRLSDSLGTNRPRRE